MFNFAISSGIFMDLHFHFVDKPYMMDSKARGFLHSIYQKTLNILKRGRKKNVIF